jgi:putative PIN family toxin of toxin-antitoxin system
MSELCFVFDTNTVVSALLLRQSVSRQAFDEARQQGQLLLSLETLNELNDVLRREKFNRYVSERERLLFLSAFVQEAMLVEVHAVIQESRDPKDDKFLVLAVSGQADFIISGDKDLLVLDPFHGIPIVTPRQLLNHFQQA